MTYRAPVIEDILRRHAEQAAFLWTVYDRAMLHPEENPDMDEDRISRLVERIDAHIDALHVSSPEGLRVAEERYAEFPEKGELFLVRMLKSNQTSLSIKDLNLDQVRLYLSEHVN